MRLQLGDAGIGLLQTGGEAVELAFRDALAIDQAAAALVFHAGQTQFGLGRAQAGLLDIAVHLDQRLLQADLLTGTEQHLLHGATDLHRQVHALKSLERADGGQATLPWAFFCRRGVDADGRLRCGEHLHLLVDGEAFVGGEGEYHDEYCAEHK